MAVTIDGTTGVSLVQDGVITAADLASKGLIIDMPAYLIGAARGMY